MSRTDDFAKAGQALAETKRTSEAQAQCRYDFDIAAEYGYQYAIEKACEYLYDWNKKQAEKHGSKAVLGIREFTIIVNDFHKAMQ